MAQDLQIAAAPLLPVLDLDRPTFLASQPSWLASRIDAESRSEHRRIVRDATGRQIGEVRTLPQSLMLTGAMRAVLTRRIAELEAALEPGPPEDTVEHIARLCNRYFAGKTDDDLAVRAETYLDAVDGLPAWTVREAIRRWFGGKYGGIVRDKPDYSFAPAEAHLRHMADRIVQATRGQIVCFERLLLAEPEPEISEAVRARQAAALQALAHELGAAKPEVVRPKQPEKQPEPMRERAVVAADLEEWRARRVVWEAEDAAKAAAADAEAAPDPVADPTRDPPSFC